MLSDSYIIIKILLSGNLQRLSPVADPIDIFKGQRLIRMIFPVVFRRHLIHRYHVAHCFSLSCLLFRCKLFPEAQINM